MSLQVPWTQRTIVAARRYCSQRLEPGNVADTGASSSDDPKLIIHVIAVQVMPPYGHYKFQVVLFQTRT